MLLRVRLSGDLYFMFYSFNRNLGLLMHICCNSRVFDALNACKIGILQFEVTVL